MFNNVSYNPRESKKTRNPYLSGQATPRVESVTDLGITSQVFKIQPQCHPHLEPLSRNRLLERLRFIMRQHVTMPNHFFRAQHRFINLPSAIWKFMRHYLPWNAPSIVVLSPSSLRKENLSTFSLMWSFCFSGKTPRCFVIISLHLSLFGI